MKKVLICISVFGLLGYLVFSIFLEKKIAENFEIPVYLLIIGLIYFPFLIMFLIDKKKGDAEKYEPKTFSDYRFIISGVIYFILLFFYLIIIIGKMILK